MAVFVIYAQTWTDHGIFGKILAADRRGPTTRENVLQPDADEALGARLARAPSTEGADASRTLF